MSGGRGKRSPWDGALQIPTSQGSKTFEAEAPRRGEDRRHCHDLAGMPSIKTSRTCTPDALQATPGPSGVRVTPVRGLLSTVQAAGGNVATVGPEACHVRSEACQSVTQQRGEVAHQHLNVGWLGLPGARQNMQKMAPLSSVLDKGMVCCIIRPQVA